MRGLVFTLLLCSVIGSVSAQQPLNKRDQKKKAEFEARIVAEEKYEAIIKKADEAFKKKNYVDARMLYAEAIQYNPKNEQWLTSKVNDLDILMAKNIARQVDSVEVMVTQANPYQIKVEEETPVKLESRPMPASALKFPKDTAKTVKKEPEPTEKPVTETPKPAPPAVTAEKPVQPLEEKTEKPVEVKVKEDFSHLPQGRTEETFDFPDHQVLRIVIREGIDTMVYKKVTHRWGAKFYFKDDVSMAERIWLEEVTAFRQKYP